ncbi:uncharacterized protein LOC143854932 isoform X2 [Tasmannia lanceolata]|uniref:uncharacterized protein LOC143854932 isoform X2 n=1 Tax=Tasmannia lanceolata TaxID=3420 RepID=UPI0040648C3A
MCNLQSDLVFPVCGESITTMATHRKLKESGYTLGGNTKKKPSLGNVHLEDYHNIDPVPSSKASIKPKPIAHGTPLMPYIPQPTPPAPSHPRRGGVP